MMIIYEINQYGIWTGNQRTLSPGEGRPRRGWTPIAPPEVPEGKMAQLRGRVWVIIDDVPESDRMRELVAAKAAATARINEAYLAATKGLIKDYPDPEPLSWAHQDAEAQAYLAWHDSGAHGDPPPTPTLDYILVGRNGDTGTETLRDLCLAVRGNAEAFKAAQVLTGQRQRMVKQIAAATTVEEIEEVVWE